MNDSYLEVLKQYEGEVTNVRRGRGAWICEYPDGPRLLKEYRGTVKRLEFEDAVLGQLEERDRKLIQLRYFQNKTQVQTAKELDMTQVQVSRREKKILLWLRGMLI